HNYENLGAIGVAGMTRAMAPDLMEETLKTAFTRLKQLKPAHVHYKVCSTFDSSPTIGSIGKAIDTGAAVFENTITPLLVAAPLLGRYCMFGNLFARMGIGSQGKIYRLDRHPSMSKHPTTPAMESDLRMHLSHQTAKTIGLFDILEIAKEKVERLEALNALKQENAEIILFDALDETHMLHAGELIDSLTAPDKTLFSAGSSGVEAALGSYWNQKGIINQQNNWAKADEVDVLLVASGSCSPVTSTQIATAVDDGFMEIAIDTLAFVQQEAHEELVMSYAHQAAALLKQGKSVIIHTSTGPDDQRIAETADALKQNNSKGTAEIYGTALGKIVKAILDKINKPGLSRLNTKSVLC
ncbi:MAG: four-carbon acid sugar kinase family protein, partial [Pedobacter sp.]